MSEQGDEREQSQQRRGGSADRHLRPLFLRLASKMLPHLLEDYSRLQRNTNQKILCLEPPSGSRASTQRKGTANKPVEYQAALSEETSTMRSPLRHHLAVVVSFETAFGSSATSERLGSRSPLRQGLPICPGRRGGLSRRGRLAWLTKMIGFY